jgi:carboxylesterase
MQKEYIHNAHLEGDAFFWENGPVGVLLAHGYSATAAEVRPLAQILHEQGYSVSGPLLPGHGTTPQEMNRCRWQDWAQAMEQAYQEVKSHCQHVFVGGESMGAVLAAYLASEHAEVAGILAYAPAMRLPTWIAIRARLGARFIPFVPKRGLDSAKRWQGYTVNPIPALVQLMRLQAAMRPRLALIHQPLLIVQGRLDRVVDLRGIDLLHNATNSSVKELHWMEHSRHVVILDNELPQVAELTQRFMDWAVVCRSQQQPVSIVGEEMTY